MKRLINIISLTAEIGTSTVSASQSLDSGKIIGVSIYKNGVNNPGFVRAAIKDNSGTDVVPLHHIDDFRNRETAYGQGYMPLQMEGGKKVTVDIQASANFSANTDFEAVFYYEESQNC